MAKKKAVENGTLPASSSSNSPAGGIKKRPSSVAPSTPTNSKKRKLASPVKKEDLDESDVDVVLSRTAEARTGRVPVRAQVESEDEFDVEFF